jgi:hypothetical protein
MGDLTGPGPGLMAEVRITRRLATNLAFHIRGDFFSQS